MIAAMMATHIQNQNLSSCGESSPIREMFAQIWPAHQRAFQTLPAKARTARAAKRKAREDQDTAQCATGWETTALRLGRVRTVSGRGLKTKYRRAGTRFLDATAMSGISPFLSTLPVQLEKRLVFLHVDFRFIRNKQPWDVERPKL